MPHPKGGSDDLEVANPQHSLLALPPPQTHSSFLLSPSPPLGLADPASLLLQVDVFTSTLYGEPQGKEVQEWGGGTQETP